MPVKDYGVLRCRAVGAKREDGADTPHYQVHVTAEGVDYRLAINVKSQLSPSELLFVVAENFQHPIVQALSGLSEGFTALPSRAPTSLDFIRGNLFNRLDMRLLPPSLPGEDNDLSDRLAHYIDRAMREQDAEVYVFGSRWGPERGKADKVFQFEPGNGLHDIHMNQGNDHGHRGDDGVWQDGGLILRFPSTNQWTAIFLAFQSQAWHTDDVTGHALSGPTPGPGPAPHESEPDFRVRIIAALVNPVGPAPEAETVTLLNATPAPIDLAEWKLIDKADRAQALDGQIEAGATRLVSILPPAALGNSGGTITLVDAKGLKVNGVAYTGKDASAKGWTVVF